MTIYYDSDIYIDLYKKANEKLQNYKEMKKNNIGNQNEIISVINSKEHECDLYKYMLRDICEKSKINIIAVHTKYVGNTCSIKFDID